MSLALKEYLPKNVVSLTGKGLSGFKYIELADIWRIFKIKRLHKSGVIIKLRPNSNSKQSAVSVGRHLDVAYLFKNQSVLQFSPTIANIPLKALVN